MAAGFLGGFNATTLAKHRLTRPLYLRRVNQILPGAYPYDDIVAVVDEELTRLGR